MEHITCIILFFAALTAVYTDLKTGLIKNWLTLPLWAGGLIFSFFEKGLPGVGSALGAGLLVVVSTFKFSTPGGGDIKLGMGVGAWIGVSGWPAYFIGAALTRIFLSLVVKFKIYDGCRGFLGGLKYELVTGTVPPYGEKNFKLFQSAAEKTGENTNIPVVPGALWVAGGVVSYIVYVILTG